MENNTCTPTNMFKNISRAFKAEILKIFKNIHPQPKTFLYKKGVYIDIPTVRIGHCRNFVYSELSFSIPFSVTFYQKLRTPTRRSLTTTRNLRALREYIRPLKNQSERAKYLCLILIVEHEMSYPAMKRNWLPQLSSECSCLVIFQNIYFGKTLHHIFRGCRKIAHSIQTMQKH